MWVLHAEREGERNVFGVDATLKPSGQPADVLNRRQLSYVLAVGCSKNRSGPVCRGDAGDFDGVLDLGGAIVDAGQDVCMEVVQESVSVSVSQSGFGRFRARSSLTPILTFPRRGGRNYWNG